MASNAEARTEILRRVRAATGVTADSATISAGWSALRRGYRQTSELDREQLMHQLEDRLLDYDAGVSRCAPDELRERIGRILADRGHTKLATAAGFAYELPAGVNFVEDTRADVAQIDACEGVLTSATLAIAETGTIVLQDAPGQGRRALTLLPDYHLCVVEAGSIVRSVPEAMAILQATAARSTTFFSGPSATADIEMTRIKGVHGPRFVDVILITR